MPAVFTIEVNREFIALAGFDFWLCCMFAVPSYSVSSPPQLTDTQTFLRKPIRWELWEVELSSRYFRFNCDLVFRISWCSANQSHINIYYVPVHRVAVAVIDWKQARLFSSTTTTTILFTRKTFQVHRTVNRTKVETRDKKRGISYERLSSRPHPIT